MSLQVIGAGYGRTGTFSLKQALEILGYNKCYHMVELFKNPSQITHWEEAHKNKVNWAELFKDYQAAVDFPASIYYKKLIEYYPEAKVVLTYRDPESWYESVKSTIFSADPGIDKKINLLLRIPFSSNARCIMRIFKMNDSVIWNGLFEGKFKDKTYAMENYIAHAEEVKRIVPKERLLIYKSGDGWEPLCRFLNKPVPEQPYPSSNAKENFKKFVRALV